MSVKVGLKYIEIGNESMEDKICEYEREPIVKGQIVLYGPSNFTRWSSAYGNLPARQALLGKSGAECVINRGFGSSCPEHQLYYYSRMIKPLEPTVLVYSPFGNYPSFGYSVEEAWELAQRVIVYSKTDFPNLKIYLCGAYWKPNMNFTYLNDVKWARNTAKSFCEYFPDAVYVDPFSYEPLQNESLFIDDKVHFNKEGYEIYADFFRRELKLELDRF